MITKASKAARSRAVADAKCSRTPLTDTLMEGLPITPQTLVRKQPQDLQVPSTTGLATHYLPVENSNRFTPLPFNV
jgi:hypothetical protein